MNPPKFQWLVLRSLLWLVVKNGGSPTMRVTKDLEEGISKLEENHKWLK